VIWLPLVRAVVMRAEQTTVRASTPDPGVPFVTSASVHV
jgi:hypothetical protein